MASDSLLESIKAASGEAPPAPLSHRQTTRFSQLATHGVTGSYAITFPDSKLFRIMFRLPRCPDHVTSRPGGSPILCGAGFLYSDTRVYIASVLDTNISRQFSCSHYFSSRILRKFQGGD